MKPLLLGALALMTGSVAYAQDPTPSPKPNTMPPANQAAPATPDMKSPTQAAPPATVAPKSTNADARAPTFIPDQSWVGRYVYSSDGKDLGKIASVKRTGASSDIFFDMGGFLGIGTTRKHVAAEQVRDVQNDRIVLNLNKAQAEGLPSEK
jgi:hypothetical protein